MKTPLLPLLCLLSILAGADAAVSKLDALELFKRYQALEKQYNPEIADLFSDNIVFHLRQYGDGGASRVITVRGKAVKERFRSATVEAERLGGTSLYNNINVRLEGGLAVVEARRYSKRTQYYDNDFKLVVAESPDNGPEIVELYASNKLDGEASGKLTVYNRLKTTLPAFNRGLPRMIDEGTRFDRVEVRQPAVLCFCYSLVNTTIRKLDTQGTMRNMRPILANDVCANPSLRKMIEDGATIRFEYRDQSGAMAFSVEFDELPCD